MMAGKLCERRQLIERELFRAQIVHLKCGMEELEARVIGKDIVYNNGHSRGQRKREQFVREIMMPNKSRPKGKFDSLDMPAIRNGGRQTRLEFLVTGRHDGVYVRSKEAPLAMRFRTLGPLFSHNIGRGYVIVGRKGGCSHPHPHRWRQ